MQISINSHGYIEEDGNSARDVYYPYFEKVMNRIGEERGWRPTSRASFDAVTTPTGALLVGSPEEIADKIVYEHSLFGNTRFTLQISISSMSHERVMKSIELFGQKVKPLVLERL
jgi:alkanesulfonate monooxygenase SsuD/methylene tetrahydromethanopterin reductase-like flavin-dependent oxidoreductase (luciferase family)